MKIGIDVRLWNETGVGRYIRNLVKYLQIVDKINEYILFCLDNDDADIKAQITNFKFQTKSANIHWHSAEEQVLFPIILNRENLDLLHFPYFSVPILYTRPFIITIHDLIIYHYSTGQASTLPLPLYKLKRIGYKIVLKRIVNKANKIIVPSMAVKADLIKSLNISSHKIEVTYEGVDELLAKSKRKSEYEIKQKQKYFLYVGNAYPHKNLDILVTAFQRVSELSSINLQLIMVGKADYFYKQLSLKLKDKTISNVRLIHNADDFTLQLLYQDALAVIAPSFDEGFGLVPLEAMANNCLVLVSDNAAHKEICNDAAIYFNAKNYNQLTVEMLDIVNNNNSNEYRSKRKKGIERVKFFEWKKMAVQTHKIYEQFKK